MALAALETVTDAIEATTDFLRPVDAGRWFRMAVVVFFVAGGGGLSLPFNAATSATGGGAPGGGRPGAGPGTGPVSNVSLPPLADVLVLVAVAVAALLTVGLVVWAVGSVMEFVFVAALRSEAVRVRRQFRQHLGAGLRLFAFRLGVSLLSLAVLGAVGAAVAFGIVGGSPLSWGAAQALAFVAFLVPVLAVVVFVNGLVLGFTTVFVVPVMLLEDRGVLSAWRRFWPTLRGNPTEYAVYAVLGFLLSMGVGLAIGTVVGIGAVAVLIPVAILGGVVFVAAGGALTTPVLAVLGILGALYLVAVLSLAALVAVPFQTFLRYYALLVLGDTNEALDPIPEVRARIRERGPTPPTAG